MFCSKCGKELSDSAQFCSSCGTKTALAAPNFNNNRGNFFKNIKENKKLRNIIIIAALLVLSIAIGVTVLLTAKCDASTIDSLVSDYIDAVDDRDLGAVEKLYCEEAIDAMLKSSAFNDYSGYDYSSIREYIRYEDRYYRLCSGSSVKNWYIDDVYLYGDQYDSDYYYVKSRIEGMTDLDVKEIAEIEVIVNFRNGSEAEIELYAIETKWGWSLLDVYAYVDSYSSYY